MSQGRCSAGSRSDRAARHPPRRPQDGSVNRRQSEERGHWGAMTSVDLGWLEIERARYELLLDSLTGLPRWALLIDRTAVSLARARRTGNQIAVFVLDDPRYSAGPPDIVRIAKVLESRVRPDDTLARIGDRRFAVVCN